MVPSRSRNTSRRSLVATRSPCAQAGGFECELAHGCAHLRQRLLDMMLPAVVAVEEHVAAAACPGHFAADGAGPSRLLVHLVDRRRGDLRGEPLLLLPRGAEELREVAQPAAQKRVLHLA